MALKLYTDYRLGGIPKFYVSREEDRMLIPDEVRKCVVFLLYRDQNQNCQFAGTGFFMSVQIERVSFIYLVTAKHVIVEVSKRSSDSKVYIRINDKQGGSKLLETDINLWKKHPTDSSVDASVLAWAPQQEMSDYRIIPSTMIATDEIIKRESIGLGDEVFITGLFINHFGKTRNQSCPICNRLI
jgi:hypothetical protein